MRVYDPAATINPLPTKIPDGFCRRIVVIDGTNLIYKSTINRVHGINLKSETKNANGLLFMVYELLRNGYEVLVTIKSHVKNDPSIENSFIFDELEDMEILKYVPGDGRNNPLDDKVSLKFAEKYSAAVISNDQFKDHAEDWPNAVSRRIGFSFNCPENPTLESLTQDRFNFTTLTFKVYQTPLELDNFDLNVAICKSSDPDYENVKAIYRQISPKYFVTRIRKCEMIADFIQIRNCIVYGKPKPKLKYLEPIAETKETTFKEFRDKYRSRYEDGSEY